MSFSKSGSKKLVIIAGPTATGKTALALKVAKEVGGEIVAADARQIYRGMDVGTGKELPVNAKFTHPSPRLRRVPLEVLTKWGKIQSSKLGEGGREFRVGYYLVGGVKVWLYDVVAPDQYFAAADYRKVAWPVIKDIWRRGKLPLVVGGTGFYIRSLLQGLGSEGVPPDWEWRKQLDSWTVAQLAARLQELAPERWKRMNASDRKNPRRLVRAIELGTREQVVPEPYPLTPLFLGLTAPYPSLYQRIDQRVEAMMRAGLLREVVKLVKRYGWAAPGLNGIGYRQCRPYFEGKGPLGDFVQRVKYDTHAYARRQMTWFRREPGIVWFDVSRPGFDEKVVQLVKSFR